MFTEFTIEVPKGPQALPCCDAEEGCFLEVIKPEGALLLASSTLVCIASTHRSEKQLQGTTVTPISELGKPRRKAGFAPNFSEVKPKPDPAPTCTPKKT